MRFFILNRNSIVIETCSKVQPIAYSYSGEDVLGGWTDKIHVGGDKEYITK
jgi:hypothetical protein